LYRPWGHVCIKCFLITATAFSSDELELCRLGILVAKVQLAIHNAVDIIFAHQVPSLALDLDLGLRSPNNIRTVATTGMETVSPASVYPGHRPI
jgi:hypothetical protein